MPAAKEAMDREIQVHAEPLEVQGDRLADIAFGLLDRVPE
jgi:hypothetical protein